MQRESCSEAIPSASMMDLASKKILVATEASKLPRTNVEVVPQTEGDSK